MRVSRQAQDVRIKQTQVTSALHGLQENHGLTDIEMLQAVQAFTDGKLGDMLRRERHPDDPDKAADEA